MGLRIFLVAAVVLIVFGIIASAETTGATPGQLFGVTWYSWFMASFLAYLADLIFGFGYADGRWGRAGTRANPPA
jgi:hypothetical protein